MTDLRIAYSDNWVAFDADASLWTRILSLRYRVAVVGQEDDPDLLIYGDWGTRHRAFRGRKIYWTGENMLPDFDQCDFAMTSAFLPNEPRHLRVPTWRHFIDEPSRLVSHRGSEPSEAGPRPEFCGQVVSNPKSPLRNRMFRRLNRRRRVNSGGRAFNTTGSRVRDKAEFLRRHRFCLAFENSSSPGYTTEKLLDALLAGCIPIYWGNPDVGTDFNPRRFVNAHDFEDLDSLCDRVIELDDDPEAQAAILKEPILPGNSVPSELGDEDLADGLVRFIESGSAPGRRRYRRRRVREHVHRSWLHQTAASWACRVDATMWRLGIRL